MQVGQAGNLAIAIVVVAALAIAKASSGAAVAQAGPPGVQSARPAARLGADTEGETAPLQKPRDGDAGGASTPDGGPRVDEDPCGAADWIIASYEALYPRPGSVGDPAVRGGRFHHLIALVPDPVATERSDAFDSALEGVEEAVAGGVPVAGGATTVSYVRDHYWIPWSGSDEKKAKRCWLKHPGVLLYRPAGDPRAHPAFLVLLVGETPTWGVQRDQLEAAIQLVVRDDALESSDAGPELRIVGPTFSGSAPSLAAVLRERPADAGPDATWPAHVSIASGTATNAGIKDLLVDLGDAGTATYATTTPSDRDRLAAMWAFLETRGARGPIDDRPGNAVLLTESVTAYGQGVAAQSDGGSACGASSPCFEERQFPLDVASVQEAEGEGDAGAPAPHARGAAELSEDTPYVHGLELAEVLRELSRDNARFVGLVATNPRDVLFLAQRIRDELPDVRLFTLAADIRYLDSTHAQALDGMLVAHAADDGAQRTRSIALANERVRGVYLAARRVLGEGGGPAHVQISLIGNGGLWQIGPDDDAPGAASDDPPPPQRPISWAFVLVLMMAIFVIVVAAIASPWLSDRLNRIPRIKSLKTSGFLRHRGALWAHLGRCDHLDLAADDGLVTAAMLVVVACPPLLMLASTWDRTGGAFSAPGPAALGSASVVLLGAVWVLALSGVLTARDRGAQTNWSAVIFSAAATVAALFGLTMAFDQPRATTFNLLSGASPVLAGIIGFTSMGIGLWCWRVRLRFLDSHRFGVTKGQGLLFDGMIPPIAQALGEGDAKAEGNTGIDEIERRLLKVIRSPWTTFTAVPIAIHLLLAASVVAPILIKPPQTLEPRFWNDVLVAFGILALLPITGNFSRLLATWILFRRLLRRVASHPCVKALDNLPTPLARNLTAQLAVSGGDLSDLGHVLRSFGRLAETNSHFAADYGHCRELAATELRCAAGVDGASVLDPNVGGGDRGDTEGGDGEPKGATTAGAVVDSLLDAACNANFRRRSEEAQTRAAIDDLTASLLAVFVPRYVRHFRLYMPPLIIGSILSVAMTTLYFIQPERLITTSSSSGLRRLFFSAFVVYRDLDRDPVMSAIGKTTAGSVHFDMGFVTRTVSWGLLPLASLVAAQYPALGSFVSALFNAVAKGFR